MFKTCLLFLLISIYASAKYGVIPLSLPSKTVLSCYSANSISLIASDVWDSRYGFNPNFTESYNNAKALGISNYHGILNLNDSWDATNVCYTIAKGLPTTFGGYVWLNVAPNAGYWRRPLAQRISYVESVAQTCKQYGLKIGIHSNMLIWQMVFGNRFASSSVLNSLPLWYWVFSDQPNFNDFSAQRFGGWGSPSIKTYIMGKSFCNATSIALMYIP